MAEIFSLAQAKEDLREAQHRDKIKRTIEIGRTGAQAILQSMEYDELDSDHLKTLSDLSSLLANLFAVGAAATAEMENPKD